MKHLNLKKWSWLIALGFAACGGSGGSASSNGTTNSSGVDLPSQLSLVADQSIGSSSSLSKYLKFATIDLGGDYATDIASIHVDDGTGNGLQMINSILCSLSQTKYSDMLDQGDYIALIDNSICDSGHSNGQDGSGKTVSLEKWIVNSTLEADGTALVNFYITTEDGGGNDPFNQIRAQLHVIEGVSDTNKYGLFELNFAGFMNDTPTMTGVLASTETTDGTVNIVLNMDGGDSFSQNVHAILSPDGSQGQALVSSVEGQHDNNSQNNNPVHLTMDVDYDSSHYLISYNDHAECKDRINLEQNVWGYNLYDETGTRVDRNSGFSVKDSNNHWGYVGYYGLWFQGDSIPATVTDNDGVVYNTFQGVGKFTRSTKMDFTMADLVGKELMYYDFMNNSNKVVSYSDSTLTATGEQECDQNGCSTQDLQDEPLSLEPNMRLGFWINGFGNADVIVPSNGIITDETPIVVFKHETAAPSDADMKELGLELVCQYQCPKAGLTQDDVNNGNVYLPNEGAPYTYTVDTETSGLLLNGEPVELSNNISLDGSPYRYGIMSGPLYDSRENVVNPWDVYNLTTTYNYEMGSNQWNKFGGIKDSQGNFVTFDPPLYCQYNDADHGTFMLNYDGPGRLGGIPASEIEDDATGFSRWQALFVIPDMSELECDGSTYFTKAMNVEKHMPDVDLSQCSSFDPASIDPADITYTDNGLGAAPEVTSAPAVIGGILQ